jgi:ribosomal protein S18 acetylase RimI-like enzyme
MLNLKKNIILIISFLLMLFFLFLYYYKINPKNINNKKNNIEIKEYNHEKDFDKILKIIDDNFFWLFSGFSKEKAIADISKTFIEKKILVNETNKYSDYNIQVLHFNNELAGFITYYKFIDKIGRILFLCIDEKYRRFGFAKILLEKAIKDLFENNKDIERIFLLTRLENIKAQNLYKKFGFIETERDENLMLEKEPNIFFILEKNDYYLNENKLK